MLIANLNSFLKERKEKMKLMITLMSVIQFMSMPINIINHVDIKLPVQVNIKNNTPSKKGNSLKEENAIKSETLQAQQTKEFFSYQLLRNHLVALINKERKNAVSLYKPLLTSASLRAKEAHQLWSHTRPNGKHWNTTLNAIIDINYTYHGENLAQVTLPVQSFNEDSIHQIALLLHQGLVNSPTHYQVMTNQTYKKVNIGIYVTKQEEIYQIVIAEHFIQ